MTNSTVIWLLIIGDQSLLERCILKLYQQQTSNEKMDMQTYETNGAGLTKGDAHEFTKLAEQLMRSVHLTPLQVEIITPRMKKYVKQLTTLMDVE
jgi:hypothetical protein